MATNKTHTTTYKNIFMGDHFLLENDYAAELYHDFAKALPIIDYHNHLSPQEIAEDKKFDNLTQVWLYGDHYKWRAMRANGINERFITGDATDWEKFEKWAETVPYTMRNPLYHWTHLELRRYFDVDLSLNKEHARIIFDECNFKLNSQEYTVKNLLRKMKVETLCTTDDPTDSLAFHQKIKESEFEINVLPTFRPDKIISIQHESFQDYVKKLSQSANININSFEELLLALQSRVDFFHQNGCRISDYGLEQIYAFDFRDSEVNNTFKNRLNGKVIEKEEALKFQSAVLYYLGKMYHTKGWVQQFHLGALRNQNSRLLRTLGPDTGFDSIGDFSHAVALGRFLNRLDKTNQLAKTILYNLNPGDNEVLASMAGNFNDGTIVGKMQFGSAWWFLDQLDGMEKQINTLSSLGLLSCFIGMLTDSRSFLSFPRHEYFRRLLCNIFGRDIERGHLPADIPWIGKLIRDICYFNAKKYFGF